MPGSVALLMATPSSKRRVDGVEVRSERAVPPTRTRAKWACGCSRKQHNVDDPPRRRACHGEASSDEGICGREEFEEPAVIEGSTVEESAAPGNGRARRRRRRRGPERRRSAALNGSRRKGTTSIGRRGRIGTSHAGGAVPQVIIWRGPRATDPRRARMTKAERRKRDDEARELFLSKWSLPDGS